MDAVDPNAKQLHGVREHRFGNPVWLENIGGRAVIAAAVNRQYETCAIDVVELVAWLKDNRPELIMRALEADPS